MDGDRGTGRIIGKLDKYYFEETEEERNAPPYSSALMEKETDKDLPKKMIEKPSREEPISHGHSVNPIAEFGRKSLKRKYEELGGKSGSPRSERERTSKFREFLFEKTLTSIDCKDFFAISTENALAHFPSLQTSKLGDFSAIETLDILNLASQGKSWRMDFVYFFDRRVYGISKGWNEFVTEYNLKAGDMVDFHKSTHPVLCKQYYIDVKGKETTETESTATSVQIKKIKMYGLELNYLFEKKLTPLDVCSNLLEIPTQEGKKHFPPLNLNPDGVYTTTILVFDAQKVLRELEIRLIVGGYFITGNWNGFVSTHKLRGKDVIRFFKIISNVFLDYPLHDCYLIDYVKAKEVEKKSM